MHSFDAELKWQSAGAVHLTMKEKHMKMTHHVHHPSEAYT